MTPATPGQKLIIDSRRHPTECHHPSADEFISLTFLSCKRCGVELCDGALRFVPVVLAADDPPMVTQNSSYAGELAEDVAEAIVARLDANAPAG